MNIYLCGPINGKTDAECVDWRERVKAQWPFKCIDPMRRDYRGRELEPGAASQIVDADMRDIDAADGLLMRFEHPSVGSSMEMFYAHQRGIPVAVWNVQENPLSPWLIAHAGCITPSLKEAIGFLLSSYVGAE